MVKAYLLSYLTQRYFLNAPTFAEAHNHAWLVWEPGSWKAPSFDEQTQVPKRTRDGALDAAAALAKGDALCFALKVPTDGLPVRVGRAPTNQLVINDGTVSREHLVMTWKASQRVWAAALTSHAPHTTHCGVPFSAGASITLVDGDTLGLGSINLTFHDVPGFARRLDQEVSKQLGRATA